MDDDARRSMTRIGEATDRLLASAATLTDASAREPSLLPGWTRGHVLTHVARNADGLGNLLRWARTGTKTPMYASREARRADIEAGAGRPAADLAADVQRDRHRLRRRGGQPARQRPGRPRSRCWPAPRCPPAGCSDWRLREVEIHHVDLATGYRPADWPAEFVADNLPEVAGSFAGRDDAPSCLLRPDGSDSAWRIGSRTHGRSAGQRARPGRRPAGLADRPGRRQRPAGLRRRRRAGAAPVEVGGRPRRIR